ncbi:hypothetical protein [Helicobacter sp. 11S02596-1]|uniref:hypothetical protein n=1 Tax=Helicobacter sp. 11S02596-1 TaxID=1476194 RepID=UPI000BA600B5|nr:hypothetical protein [Helicobacter sp. 11S02596-1]PAF44514.1 hypothetical protein BJI48_03060 [Helicobacter sp. 11S02596-1]
MYDTWFYIFFWVVSFLLALPVVMLGFVWIILQKPAPQPRGITLEDLEAMLGRVKNQADLENVLEKFLKNFQVFPKDDTDLKRWLSIIAKMASSEHFDIDSVARFGQKLEDANKGIENDIAETVGLALKTRKKR